VTTDQKSHFSHTSLYSLQWALLTEGVLLYRKPSPGWRVSVHWALQAAGLTLAILGFLAIWRNKEDGGKLHFTTYHGLTGILTLAFLVLQAVGGNVANFSVALSKNISLIRPRQVKAAHRSAGALALAATSASVFLALFSFWFNAVTPSVLGWWSAALLTPLPLFTTLRTTYFQKTK